jgi:transcription elongation factor Elf1
MPKSSGFVCPKCKSDKSQTITGKDLVHILELKCDACGFAWAVEGAYPVGFKDPGGKVHG